MDSIAGFTRDGAFTEFAEGQKGVLKPGMLADLVILDRDIESVAPEEIAGMMVAGTICGGEMTYQRPL